MNIVCKGCTHLQVHGAVLQLFSEHPAHVRGAAREERTDEDDVCDVMTLGAEVDLSCELVDHEEEETGCQVFSLKVSTYKRKRMQRMHKKLTHRLLCLYEPVQGELASVLATLPKELAIKLPGTPAYDPPATSRTRRSTASRSPFCAIANSSSKSVQLRMRALRPTKLTPAPALPPMIRSVPPFSLSCQAQEQQVNTRQLVTS